jgi:hypothetical protein
MIWKSIIISAKPMWLRSAYPQALQLHDGKALCEEMRKLNLEMVEHGNLYTISI